MVTVHAGTFLLGENRTLSKRLLSAVVGFCLLASAVAVVSHLIVPSLRAVAAYTSLAILAISTLAAVVVTYRNQGLVVCWALCFAPVFAAVANGMVGLTGAYPSIPKWLLMGVQFGAPAGVALGTVAFLVGFGGRLVTDWYSERRAQVA